MKIKGSETVRVYLTGGGRPYLIIGTPFMGISAYLFYLGVSELILNKESIMASIIFMVVGPVFLFIGVLLTLFREGVTLDRLQGTAAQWRKIMRLKTLAVHKLNEFSSIELYIHRSPKRTGHMVQLTGDSKKLILCDLLNLQAAKESAKDASIFLSLPINDKTTA